MRLKDKVAVITGAARGLGRVYALRFAQEGASVAVLALRTDEAGRIDVLVNNAARYGDMNIADQSVEYFVKLLNTNVLSVVVASRACYPYMKQHGGSIINIASTAAYPLPLPMPPDPATAPISGYAAPQ